MRLSQIIVVSLLLLILSAGIESYRIQKRESPTYLSQVQDFFTNSWEDANSKVHELWDQAANLGVKEKITEVYEKGTSAVSTYTNILYDQAYHWWWN